MDIQKVTWEVQYLSPLPVWRHCKKCGEKTKYICSELFRVNAQQKDLDIWLIYRCSVCDTTWNMSLFSRISSKRIKPELLEQFYTNDRALARQYAMDFYLINKNGAEAGLPEFRIVGEDTCFLVPTELHIKSQYASQIKVSKIISDKLGLSQKTFTNMVECGQIRSIDGKNLKKCKLNKGVVISFFTCGARILSQTQDPSQPLRP